MHPDEREEMDLQAMRLGRTPESLESEDAALLLRSEMAENLAAESAVIAEALRAGKFVVQALVARFGPRDEILFHSTHFVAAFDTREEACASLERMLEDAEDDLEHFHEIVPRAVAPVPRRAVDRTAQDSDSADFEIPF